MREAPVSETSPAVATTDIPEEKVISFDEGIPGFSSSRRFVLVDAAPDSAFQLLQSVDTPDVSMIVTVPWLFFPDYAPEIPEVEQHSLAEERPDAGGVV